MPMNQARTLTVSGAALPRYGDTSILTPTLLRGTAALGELFEYTLELKTPDSLAFSPSIAANIDLDTLIGSEVTCSIEIEGKGEFIAGMTGDSGAANIGAGIREITGLVTHARIIGEEGRSIVYGLTLRPWLWLATKNQDSRLFQDMTVVEITDSVLGAYTFPVDKRLIETYPKRDIQRQYWESDFDFIGRLWQEWGIYFWFEHSGGKHRLVLCDSIGAHKPHGPAYQTIRYEAPTGKRIDEEHIHALTVQSALTTGTVSTLDYDYTWPRADLRTMQQDPRDTAFADQEYYDWGDYAQPQAGATGLSGEHNQPKQEAEFLARVRAQMLRCEGLRASGTGNLRGLETGQTFTLAHYPQSEANREYLVISSTLDIANIGEETQPSHSANIGQRYRITLADGQLIDGTTNALGETTLVLSESVQMATLAFLRHDGTDNAIAIHTPMLTKSADAANEGANAQPSLALEKRVAAKQQIGTRSAQLNEVQPTSAGKDAMYAQCSPNNWGMRYSTERDKASGQLEYPVAREYMRTMRTCLMEQVQWGKVYLGPEGGKAVLRLTWPLSRDDRRDLARLLLPTVGAALSGPSAAGFGIPETAWPTISIKAFGGGNAVAMGMFTASQWELAVNETWLKNIFEDALSDKEAAAEFKRTVIKSVRELAKTLYHEARHCQQSFWINAMVQQQPQNFERTPNIAKWPAVAAGSDKPTLDAITNASITPIPDEPSALIGIKRMAIGEYFREIRVWQASRWYPPYAPDETSMAQEVLNARTAAVGLLQNAGTGGTPIDVDKMAAEPYAQMQDYAGRPWEDDAFFCETVAGGYWDLFSGQALRTMPADECSPAYVLASKAASLLARIGSSDAGGTNSVRE